MVLAFANGWAKVGEKGTILAAAFLAHLWQEKWHATAATNRLILSFYGEIIPKTERQGWQKLPHQIS